MASKKTDQVEFISPKMVPRTLDSLICKQQLSSSLTVFPTTRFSNPMKIIYAGVRLIVSCCITIARKFQLQFIIILVYRFAMLQIYGFPL